MTALSVQCLKLYRTNHNQPHQSEGLNIIPREFFQALSRIFLFSSSQAIQIYPEIRCIEESCSVMANDI